MARTLQLTGRERVDVILDVAIIALLAVFAWRGYGSGLVTGLRSLATPVLGIWLALRHCDALAEPLVAVFRDYTVTVVLCFLLILAVVWAGFRLLHSVLARLVDWDRYPLLDQGLGVFLGLAKATALVWVLLALGLSAFPPLVHVVERSNASMRILTFGEQASGTKQLRGQLAQLPDPFGDVAGAFSLFEHARNRYDGLNSGE